MTNYEKIKAMSVEEMAELIDDSPCNSCNYRQKGFSKCPQECEEGIKEWLESEVEEDG
jgi:hypothetical protein